MLYSICTITFNRLLLIHIAKKKQYLQVEEITNERRMIHECALYSLQTKSENLSVLPTV